MLSEHRKMLEEIWDHKDDIDKPELDEQELQRLETIVQEALREKSLIRLTYYKNRKLHKLEGKIKVANNQISISGKQILFTNIIDIAIV